MVTYEAVFVQFCGKLVDGTEVRRSDELYSSWRRKALKTPYLFRYFQNVVLYSRILTFDPTIKRDNI